MRERYLSMFAVAAATAALGMAGCGGDDETTTTDTGASEATEAPGVALSADDFVQQGNAICRAGNQELDAAAETLLSGEPSDADVEAYVTDTLVPSIQGQVDAIRALPAPEELSGDVETFLDDAQAALDELEADPSLLASEPDEVFADVNQQAQDLGLTECAG
jgi:hypothetical protein